MQKISPHKKPGRPRSDRKIKIIPLTFYEDQYFRILKYKKTQTEILATAQIIRELIEIGLKSKGI